MLDSNLAKGKEKTKVKPNHRLPQADRRTFFALVGLSFGQTPPRFIYEFPRYDA
jgi:hypothetical protein